MHANTVMQLHALHVMPNTTHTHIHQWHNALNVCTLYVVKYDRVHDRVHGDYNNVMIIVTILNA